MAYGRVKWDVEVLRSSIYTLNAEKGNLRTQQSQMKQRLASVEANWKSPAGRQYQNRLQNDILTLDNVILQLEKRISSLQKVLSRYETCENQILAALRQLPY